MEDDKAFYGTVANTQCLVIGSFLRSTDPVSTPDYVCEFGASSLVRNGIPGLYAPGGIPDAIGDFQAPELYSYDAGSDTQTDLGATLPPEAAALLATTLGIRAAGSLDGIVLFAGPSIKPDAGINLFAFDSDGSYLDSESIADYSNIRKFLVVEGNLYAGVGTYDDSNSGRILRWRGGNDLFGFDEVGVVASPVAELASHEDRIVVTTWPDDIARGEAVAGLWMSPSLPENGLPAVTDYDTSWQEVWSVADYEADPITRRTYGGGALASFGEYLFWGTMHVPGLSTLAHGVACDTVGSDCADNRDPQELTLNSERAISLFRARNLTTQPEIELLYGYETMPVFSPVNGSWDTLPNGLDQSPRFGTAGFNNPLNNYTWTMQVFDDRLFVGTMDWTRLLRSAAGDNPDITGIDALDSLLDDSADALTGADLWYFPTPDAPALPESLDGLGNPATYGIRTMAATSDTLYLGTANPMNLLSDPESSELGGWELVSLNALPDNTPLGTDVSVDLAKGAVVRFCKVDSAGSTRLVSVTDVAGLDDFREARTLAAAAGVVPGSNGLPALPGGDRLQDVLSLVSSGDWQGTDCDEPARLSLPLSRAYYEPRLLQLSIDPATGDIAVQNITQQRSLNGQRVTQGRASALTTGLTSNYRGILLLVEGIAPVPVMPGIALVALALALVAYVRRRLAMQTIS